ncbi:MAG: hypothetical protein ACRDBO_00195 [Lachnospiraceae bacterium]
MRIKNISKKVIGNEKFQLLPGVEMDVVGNEAWVKNYLGRNKLVVVSDTAAETADPEAEAKAETAKQKAAEAKAAKALKKVRNDILKAGDPEAIKQLAAELEISHDENVTLEELTNLIKAAIK